MAQSLSMPDICAECGTQYSYCPDCGGIIDACEKGCCYGPDGQSYLTDCVCDYSVMPK